MLDTKTFRGTLQTLFKRNEQRLTLRIDGSDEDFNSVYPRKIRRMAEQHFTPLMIAKAAAAFLVQKPGTKVLDIGAGAGKFCLVGAAATSGDFTGVEQRKELVVLSNAIAADCKIKNTSFVHGNVMAIDFKAFDAFYLFNPFYENVFGSKRMDDAVITSPSLFASYSSYTAEQLSRLHAGTRLATYYTAPSLVPSCFECCESLDEGNLLLWEKRR